MKSIQDSGRRGWAHVLGRSLVLVAGVSAVVSATGAQAASSTLSLELSSGSQQVRYVSAAGTVTRPLVTASGTACRLDGSAPFSQYLSFGSAASVPGWRSNDRRIGVNGISSGAPCTQIREAQDITLSVGSALAGQTVVNATLNLIVTDKPTRIVVAPSLLGAPVLEPFAVECAAKAPCAIVLGRDVPQWDSVRLTTTRTQLTGEAGAWSISNSVFELSSFVRDGDLACGDSDVRPGGTLRRLFDVGATDPEECGPAIPYRLAFDGQSLEFEADYSVLPPDAVPAFAWSIDWFAESIDAPTGLVVPFEGACSSNPASGLPACPFTLSGGVPLSVQRFLPTDQQYFLDVCIGTPSFDADGELAGLTLLGEEAPGGAPHPGYDMSDLEGIQYGCYLDRTISIVLPPEADAEPEPGTVCAEFGEGTLCVRVSETGYLRGDWLVDRRLR